MATIQFIQAQSFQLSAAGQSAGDTSITVQSFKYSDGVTNIVTADLGTQCYGTLEPNNGAQEEAIQFTGVTQNANGTATLTGVSSVGFNYPYTVTSGLAKSHAGGATFILSNDAGFYGNIINYVNTTAASGAAFASTSVAGLTKLSVAPVTGSNPIALGANDPSVLASGTALYINSVKNTGIPYAIATGTSVAYTASLSSSISTLSSGQALNFLVPTTNASGVSLNINSIGAKPIVKNYNVALASGDIVTNQIAGVVYDGVNFQMVSPVASYITNFNYGNTTHDVSSTTTTTIAHGLNMLPKRIMVTGTIVAGSGTTSGISSWTQSIGVSGNMNSVYVYTAGAASSQLLVLTGQAFQLNPTTGSYETGVITADSSNIYIAWTKNSSPTGTANIIWEASA